MSGSEAGELFRDDPVARPLTYPGTVPGASGVLLGDAYLALRPEADEPVADWAVECAGERTALAGVLARLGRAPMADRRPVLAVGSNAAPAQLRRKLRSRSPDSAVPMAVARVDGIAPGVSAHVSRPGYVPAAPVVAPGRSRLLVLWPDPTELEVLDATEPNYRRRPLSVARHPVTLASGVRLPSCFVYVGRHGCLVDDGGRPRRLTGQAALIRALLAESAALRGLCGTTPEEFVDRVRDPGVREAVKLLLRDEGRVAVQPEDAWPPARRGGPPES
ncbi:hypothetical protein [Nocardiopsis sp. YSL2]|uniref:hypothetical protein n=1 Tax=Nocardiopsis sp. YSL2 TaxID=2939492 RepID=UPI0026F47608|nr:hypothetical protein [Nocardiopsis sp. YSL2]